MQAEVLALAAAFAFALGSVLQQKGTLEAPARGDDPRFLVQILRRPVWLAGGGLQVSGWVLQALALDTGSLIVVQSLTTMSLVIALPLGARITSQDITGRVWLGAAAMVAGIVFASAVVGFVLQQSALKTSILAPAMASSNAVTLFGSVAFGVTVFGEKLSSGQGRTAPALIGLAIALAGIVLLAGAKPPRAARMTPATDRSPARR